MSSDADAGLTDLVKSYLDLQWHFDPVAATAAGLSEHDHRLGTYSRDAIHRHVAALKAIAGAIEAHHPNSLSDEIDRTALLGEIRVGIHRFERERPHVRNPVFWLSQLLEGLYGLLTARDRRPDARARAAAARLRDTPGFLQSARDTLRDCPRVFVELGIQMAHAGRPLLDRIAHELPWEDREEFRSVYDAAVAALESFAGYLEREASDVSEADFAMGQTAFNFRLNFQHALRTTASEVWRYGQALVEETTADLARLSATIDPHTPWQDLVARLRAEHPTGSQPVAAFGEVMSRARRFVEERGIAPIPPGELDVVPTPDFLRPLVPFAAYQPPGAFSADRRGRLYVTPPRPGKPARGSPPGQCTHEIASTAVHEGYPGHHLQFLSAQHQPRLVRKVIGTPLTVEGWALYCEEMMGEEGFYRRPEQELFQRLALLWRAVRVVLDVGLHTRGMTFDEAVELLVGRVGVDRPRAEAEVRRYCTHPAYQLCYALGRRELKSLRAAYRDAAGNEYSLRRFHETVLSYGALPVTLIRWGMGFHE